jgi:adenosylcobinamide-GDP ribazoletransferase
VPRGGRAGDAWGLRTALGYLTVIPVAGSGPASLGRAAPWLPAVGLALGGVLAGGVITGDRLFPPAVAAGLVVALWAALTGGLHLDGLADALDGLGGGWTRERALALMRDGGIGAYGAAGLVLVLGLKIITLTSLPDPLAWKGVLLAPAFGRLAPLVLARLCPPARPEGAAQAFAEGAGPVALLLGMTVAVAAGVGLVGPWGLLLLAFTVVAAAVLAIYLRSRLGGVTGDCLGAVVETTEAGVLVLMAGLATAELA